MAGSSTSISNSTVSGAATRSARSPARTTSTASSAWSNADATHAAPDHERPGRIVASSLTDPGAGAGQFAAGGVMRNHSVRGA